MNSEGEQGSLPLATIIHDHAPPCPAETKAALTRFLVENVIHPLQAAPLWDRLTSAAVVHTEVPLGGRVAVVDPATSTLTGEYDATADLVLEHPDGSWEIVDLKLALGTLTAADRNRFALQVALYGALLNPAVDEEITATVQVLGVAQDSHILYCANLRWRAVDSPSCD